ncbi:hypothetical protein DIURU_002461 [Diutina rugosa]|uniref:Uncharacterized protein n=1 Tax=Diutina rugosa TaxID=5481 RepID=A0A642UQC5_DIURU|nr:uncharacterized protein DIURU_002461 [Diutina rugosa]KAA8903299.1 hypothetical protein DIURU_002461 [Diutina rugosa]
MLARIFKNTKSNAAPKIRVYHNCSPLSRQLYSKLHNHCNEKYQIDLQKKQTISEDDFKFLMDVVDVHPDNKNIIYNLFEKHPSQDLTIEDFKSIQAPLIIDYKNKLVAADCVSFDRVLSNYATCGMQNFTNDTLVPTALKVTSTIEALKGQLA